MRFSAAASAEKLASRSGARTPALALAVRPLPLTAREREVLGLMAQGLSNKEIEDTLVLTAGAVSKHVSNVFMKLGFRPEDSNRRVKAVLTWLRHTER